MLFLHMTIFEFILNYRKIEKNMNDYSIFLKYLRPLEAMKYEKKRNKLILFIIYQISFKF